MFSLLDTVYLIVYSIQFQYEYDVGCRNVTLYHFLPLKNSLIAESNQIQSEICFEIFITMRLNNSARLHQIIYYLNPSFVRPKIYLRLEKNSLGNKTILPLLTTLQTGANISCFHIEQHKSIGTLVSLVLISQLKKDSIQLKNYLRDSSPEHNSIGLVAGE